MMKKIKAFVMNLFCMKGSWNWAKKQMIAGYMIRSTDWVGTLKFRSNPATNVFEIDTAGSKLKTMWTLAPTHLHRDIYKSITTYEIFRWPIQQQEASIFITKESQYWN